MANREDQREHNAFILSDEHFPEFEEGYQPPESPGTAAKLRHLGTTHFNTGESEVPAKLMERPVSSGSTEIRTYTYPAAPKRNLHIGKKQTTGLYGAPEGRLDAQLNSGEPAEGNMVVMHGDRKRSPPNQVLDGHGNHKRHSSGNLPNSGHSPSDKSEKSQSDEGSLGRADQENTTDLAVDTSDGQPSKRPATLQTPGKAISGPIVHVRPPTRHRLTSIDVAPISRARPSRHNTWGDDGEAASLTHQMAGDASPRTETNAQIAVMDEQRGEIVETPEVVDLTENGIRDEQIDVASQSGNQDNRPPQIGSPVDNGRPSSSDPGRRYPEIGTGGCGSIERAPSAPRTTLHPVEQFKVAKRPLVPQQQPSSLPSGTLGGSTDCAPSEEDLYYLLLHRYRKREYTERRLTAHLRQLETENTNLCEAARSYQQQLETSATASSKQTAEIRAQKMTIDGIKNSYLKIKNFMTAMHKDQEVLRAKAASIDQDKQTLRNDYDQFQHAIEEAKTATTLSGNVVQKVKKDLARFRQDSAQLETSLHDTKSELRNEQSLLAQERRRIVRYENHIADVTRNQNRFSSTVQQGQQHLLNDLKTIKDKLINLETDQVLGTPPPDLSALDQCVEMLKALTKVETASPADVSDMIQIVRGLTESIDSFQKQAEDSSHRATITRAQAESNLLSEVTEQFNALIRDAGDQDQIAELREDKKTLEERVRGNENMLIEVRTGRVSAEKRENDLRAGNARLFDELAKLRDMASTTKRGTGPMVELQPLLMKWTSTNSLLAESLQRIEGKDKRLQGQEEQVRTLSDQLSQSKTDQQRLLEEVQNLSKKLAESVDATNREEGQVLAEKDSHISILQEELGNLKDNLSDQLKEVEQFKSVHDNLVGELDVANSQLGQAVQDQATAKSTIGSLNQHLVEMDHLREQANRASSLAHDSEAKDGDIADLQQELGSLKAVNQELEGYRVDAKNKAVEISKLNMKLRADEETSQQLVNLQRELLRHKQEVAPLKDAQERVTSLENELNHRNDEINQLNIKMADFDGTHTQLHDLQMQRSRRSDEYESMEKKLKAIEEEAARIPILETEMIAKLEEITKLRAKLAEADRISKAVPELQTQMDESSKTISGLKRELDTAYRASEELQKTKAINVTLHQRIAELQNQAAVAKQASNSVKCLSEEMQEKDAQITALQLEVARLDVESQRKKETTNASTENFINQDLAQGTWRLPEDSLIQEENIQPDHDPSAVEKETANTIHEEHEPPRKHRKRANRRTSSLLADTSVTGDSGSVRNTLERTIAPLVAVDETLADDAVGSQAPAEQNSNEMDRVPETQPRGSDPHESLSTERMRDNLVLNNVSSSPLSDVGALFDSSDQGQPLKSHYYVTQKRCEQMDQNSLRNDIAEINKNSITPESPQRTRRVEKPSQGSPPPSSSYGEPLLFDDLEGLNCLPASVMINVAGGKQSESSSQDILTSSLAISPRKSSKMSWGAGPASTSVSKSDMNEVGSSGYVQHLAMDPSPRRLRSGELASEKGTRRPLQDLGDAAMNMRPATPNLPVKERHRPNSAIKRRSEAAGIIDETTPTEKKRPRRNVSSMEVANRPGKGSRSVSSSAPVTVGQTMTGVRKSSTTTTSSRSTIVGKIAPAPGGKQGPKKPRGGSKSEVSGTMSDSEVNEAESVKQMGENPGADLTDCQIGPASYLQSILMVVLVAEISAAIIYLGTKNI